MIRLSRNVDNNHHLTRFLHTIILIIQIIFLSIVPHFMWKISGLYTPQAYIPILFLLIMRGITISLVIFYAVVILLLYPHIMIVELNVYSTILLSFYLAKDLDINSGYTKLCYRFSFILIIISILDSFIVFILDANILSASSMFKQFMVNFTFYHIAAIILAPRS